jgi:hypothetical protein
MYRLTTTLPRTRRFLSTRLPSQSRHSSGSPLPGQQSPEHFTKTGEKPQEPDEFSARSYEYSQSGGDDMVAAQGGASFSVICTPSEVLPVCIILAGLTRPQDSKDTDPLSEKTTAGKGNVVNPLELSPATTELSKCFPDTVSHVFFKETTRGGGWMLKLCLGVVLMLRRMLVKLLSARWARRLGRGFRRRRRR